MTGSDLRALREDVGLARDLVAHTTGISTARLAAIEKEPVVDPETAGRIRMSISILVGTRRKLARELASTVHQALRMAV